MTLQFDRFDFEMELLDAQNLPVHQLLKQRSSQANFAPDDLDRGQILQLLQAARCAPSSHNSQPWYFIVITNGAGRVEINQTLIEHESSWAAEAPVLLAVTLNRQITSHHHGIDYGLLDTGLAVQNILLQATSMKLSAHPVYYYNLDTIRRALNLPTSHDLLFLIAVGRPGGEPASTEASRFRKPLAEVASWDRWGGAIVTE